MVKNAHAARHVTSVGGGDPLVLEQRAGTGPGVHGSGVAESGDQGLAGVKHLLHLVARDGQTLRIIGLDVGGADD